MGVTLNTNSFWPGADHFIGRMLDAVIAVASYTSGQIHVLKCRLVWAALEKLSLENMTIRTDTRYIGDTRRCGAVISVTGGAGGSAQVATNNHSLVVDALLILGKLIGLDPVRLHVRDVRMAVRAGSRNVRGVHLGTRVGRRTKVMHAVTIGADSDLSVAFCPSHSVHARLVLLKLVHA